MKKKITINLLVALFSNTLLFTAAFSQVKLGSPQRLPGSNSGNQTSTVRSEIKNNNNTPVFNKGNAGEISLSEITMLINQKRPIFVTGQSNRYNQTAEILNILEFINDVEVYGASNALSSVVMLVDQYNESGIRLCPAGLKMAIYPISINSEGVLIATQKPTPGENYSNIDAYNPSDLVIVDVKRAIQSGEISSDPVDLSKASVYPFFANNDIFSQPNATELLKCFIRNKLSGYTWIDEFLEEEFVNKYFNLLSLNPMNRVFLNQTKVDNYYVDFMVKFDRYSFETNSYTCRVILPLGFSENLNFFPADLMVKLDANTELKIEKSSFQKKPVGLYDYNLNRIANLEYDGMYDSPIPNSYNWREIKISMSPDKARSLSQQFDGSKILPVRIQINAETSINRNRSATCYSMSYLTGNFKGQSIQVL